MRIEDELREYTAQPSEAAWERFRAGRAAAGGADESRGTAGAEPEFGAAAEERRPRERRLSPLWWSAAAGAAVLVGALWMQPQGTPQTAPAPESVPLTVPAAPSPAPKPAEAAELVPNSAPLFREQTTTLAARTDADDPAPGSGAAAERSDLAISSPAAELLGATGVRELALAENASTAPKQGSIGPSGPSQRNDEPHWAEPASSAKSWIQLDVAWENGNPYHWPLLHKNEPADLDRWGRTALAFAQKQWERIRSGEKLSARLHVPEELTVTLDLKKVSQRLALPPLNRSEPHPNEP